MADVTVVIIPDGIDGEAIRHDMLNDFGIVIGTSFGPLHGKLLADCCYGPCLSTRKHSSVLGRSDNLPTT